MRHRVGNAVEWTWMFLVMSYDYVQYLYNHVYCCHLRALHDFFRHVSTFLCQIRDLVTDVVHRARVLCSLLAISLNMDFSQRV